MAKRFTDTDKWKKSFIKSLPAEYKLFWFYVLDDCDHAGVWHIDMEIAEMRLGIKLSLEKARGFFLGKVVEFDNRTKWFLLDFISFQYGDLSEKNKMYKPVISVLKKYNLIEHISPIYGGKVKEQDKEKDIVKDKVELEILYPIEECLMIALRDSRFVKSNKTNDFELHRFNEYLEKQGKYSMNPLDYKTYFAKLKGKFPDMLKKEMTIEELREIAAKMDQYGITSSV